jgi:hypothetical protein
MFELFICILIVYGITLILVQGKIFEPAKIKLSLLINWLENKLDPSDDMVANWINDEKLGDNHQKLWNESLKRLELSTEETFKEAQKFNKIIFEDIRKEISSNSNLLKALYWALNKVQLLLQCMMCTGFWVGVIVCLASLSGGISIFGISLHIVTAVGYNILPTTFFMACLFSGTTWVIHTLVDFFYELKEGLPELFKRG